MTQLALGGGDPEVPDRYQHFRHPDVNQLDLAAAVSGDLASKSVSFDGGGLVAELEQAFSMLTGVKHSLATNSGTSALYASYYALGLGAGDDVLVPAYTFFATAMPLFRLGCQPILVDCTDNGNIDPADLIRRATPRTRAIVVTHMWGLPCDMAAIQQAAAQLGVPVIEDASHAHGATYHGQAVGSFGSVSAWSLGAAKIVTGGQGGILQSSDGDLVERARLVTRANDKLRDRAVSRPFAVDYGVTGSGMNLRIHPFSAAIILPQLEQLATQLEERRAVAKYLADALVDIPGLQLVRPEPDSLPSWYAFPLLYEGETIDGVPRELFVRALIAEGAVDADVPGSTKPLTAFRAFAGEPATFDGAPAVSREQRPGDFPRAESFHSRIVKLPGWYGAEGLTYAQHYVSAIEKVLSQQGALRNHRLAREGAYS